MLKFYYNGIKEDGGKLQKCTYSMGQLIGYPAGTITIYKTDYVHFSDEIQRTFTVENDSEITSDYIVKDIIRVEPTHPLYQAVLATYQRQQARKQARRVQRWFGQAITV